MERNLILAFVVLGPEPMATMLLGLFKWVCIYNHVCIPIWAPHSDLFQSRERDQDSFVAVLWDISL